LAFAGNDEQIFQAQSISAIYSVSNGLPREVNNWQQIALFTPVNKGKDM